MSSVSVSASSSDECCIPTTCACDDWLTAFCDYETVTLSYCGVETQFLKARSKGMKLTAANTQIGVHMSDRKFELSSSENDVEMGIGAVITDSDGTEWVVYAVDDMEAFCVKKLWARSISACFSLLENVDVFEQDCDCTDCGTTVRYKRVARVKGTVVAETASRQSVNDSNDLVYRFSGDLVKWPLRGRPSSTHRLKTKDGVFRITGVRDGGQYVPYHVDLEIDNVDCCS